MLYLLSVQILPGWRLVLVEEFRSWKKHSWLGLRSEGKKEREEVQCKSPLWQEKKNEVHVKQIPRWESCALTYYLNKTNSSEGIIKTQVYRRYTKIYIQTKRD